MKTPKHFVRLLFVFFIPFLISNCEKQKIEPESHDADYKSAELSKMVDMDDGIIVFGPEEFVRGTGKPQFISKEISIENFEHFEDTFTILIENGDENGDHRVSSAQIEIDGKVIFNPEEFGGESLQILKELPLPNEFDLTVEVRGKPGSCINLSILGKLMPGKELLTKKGGSIISADGLVRLDFPEGAIVEDQIITIKVREDLISKYTDEEVPYIVELLPDDIEFEKPVKLSFTVVAEDIDDYDISLVNDDNGIFFWNETFISQEQSSVFTYINHFSIWSARRLVFLIPTPRFNLKYKLNLSMGSRRYSSDVNSDYSKDELDAMFDHDMDLAFEKWAKVFSNAGIDLIPADDGYPNIEIYLMSREEAREKFNEDVLWDEYFEDNVTAIAATQFFPRKRLIILNEAREWLPNQYLSSVGYENSGNSGDENIERVIAHEFGHTCKLRDSEDLKYYEGITSHGLMSYINQSWPASLDCYEISRINQLYQRKYDIDLEAKCPQSIDGSEQSLNQIIYQGEPLSYQPRAIVTDGNGYGVPGVTIIFADPAGMNGQLISPVVQTNDNGIAELNQWIVPNELGDYTIEANAILDDGWHKVDFKVTVKKDNHNSIWDGLVAYWKFDETYGSVAEDSWGENNGTANNLSVFSYGVEGKSGKCADFTHGENYIATTSTPFNFGTNPFTFSAWVKINSFNFDGDWGTIIEKNNYGVGNKSPFLLVTEDGRVGFGAAGWYTNPRELVVGTTRLNQNEWHHIVGVRDEDSQKIYINGRLEASATMPNLSSGNSYNLYIGRRQTLLDTHSCSFDGYIDEMGIWGRALSENEIRQIYEDIDWID